MLAGKRMPRLVRRYGEAADSIRTRPDGDVVESDVSVVFGAWFASACALGWLVGASIHWELLAILGAIAAVTLAVEATYAAST